jgi:Complex I intermediate-associated protein 30 (CIA30)
MSLWSCFFSKSILFGSNWHVNDWKTVDDRIRGGSSKSVLEQKDDFVVFRGELDTKTLGGAGFASQVYYYDKSIDFTQFKGICVELGEFDDDKSLALNLFNHLPNDRGDGRNASGITHKAVFNPVSGGSVYLPFNDFKPTFRGKEREGPPLDLAHIHGIGIMMQSFFNKQSGPFKISIRRICLSDN